MQEWLKRFAWFYDRCVLQPGSDLGCYPIYSIAGVILLLILAIAMFIVTRRAYHNWKEEEKNRKAILARQDVADARVMEQFRWSEDKADDASNLSHEELVQRIKSGRRDVRSHIDESLHVRCPDCRELIRVDAKVCKHCVYRIEGQ